MSKSTRPSLTAEYSSEIFACLCAVWNDALNETLSLTVQYAPILLESVSAPVEYSAVLNPASTLRSAVTGIPNSKKNSSTSYVPPIGNVAPPEPDLSP